MPRRKPSTPQEIAAKRLERRRADFEAVGLQPDAAALPTAAAIEVVRKSQKTEQTARRTDVFLALCRGMEAGAYDAARRLERDLMTASGVRDPDHLPPGVTGGPGVRDWTDTMIAASRRIARLKETMPEREFWLMSELIAPQRPDAGAPREWRDTVAYITGEELADAQPALVRNACVTTAWAYGVLDGGPAAPVDAIRVWHGAPAAQAA